MHLFLRYLFVLLIPTGFSHIAQSQVAVQGRIYDITQKLPLEGVSVMATNGKGVSSDTLGNYKIVVSENDSIWFSYQGKSTPRYAVNKLVNPLKFEVSIQVKSEVLPPITVWKQSYRFDSTANRENYAKIFNYGKPKFGTSMSASNGLTPTVGVDINSLIEMFQFRKVKRMQSLQERLITEEQEKYIDYRFSKTYIKTLTGLTGEDMIHFMVKYRPDYEFVKLLNEAEMGIYILECFKDYKMGGQTPKEDIQIRVIRYEF